MAKKSAKSSNKPKKQIDVKQDDRFAKIHHDPRFRRRNRHENRVELDDRFKKMFADKEFNQEGMD